MHAAVQQLASAIAAAALATVPAYARECVSSVSSASLDRSKCRSNFTSNQTAVSSSSNNSSYMVIHPQLTQTGGSSIGSPAAAAALVNLR